MRFFSFKIFLFFFCGAIYVDAQIITVQESANGTPISDVVLYNLKKSISVVTDNKGKADISSFKTDEVIYFQNFLYKKLKITKSEILAANNLVYLDLVIEGLNEVVVSSTKFEQSKQEVPQKIIGFSAKDITFNNPQTSADALGNTGNVFVQKSQLGGGSPMIRGFSTNRLLIAVDGVRINTAIFRGGNLQNVISIDPFSIQNTEVTLGAGSVVYGSDAIGGVMSFYTKKPQLSYKDELFFKANVLTRYSSANNEKTGHFNVNLGYKKWGFLTSVSYSDFDDLRMGSHGPDDYLRTRFIERVNDEDRLVVNPNPKVQNPTGFNLLNLMQKVHYEPADNLKFDLGLHYSTTSEYGRYDRLIRPRGEGLRSAEWKYGPQRWFMSNFSVTKLSSSSAFYDKIKAVAAYQKFEESRIDRDFQSELRRTRKELVDAFSFNADLEKQLTNKTSLFYGIEYVYNIVNSNAEDLNIFSNVTTPSLTRYPDGATWQSIAAYTSLKFRPSDTFVLQTGLRYNHVISKADFTTNNVFLNLPFSSSNLNSGALTGTAGIRWIPNSNIEWNLNLSTAFRAPNIDDIGKVFDSEPGSVVVPNNTLEPEYAYSGELGLKLNFGNAVQLDMATYYVFLNNALIRRDFELNGENEILYDGELSNVQAIQNASMENIYGFEMGVDIKLLSNFKLRSQYNVVSGFEEANGIKLPVRHVAPNFGRTHLTWNEKKWLFDAFIVYNGTFRFTELAPSEISKAYIYAQDKNGNPFSPSWYTLNSRFQFNVNDKLQLTAILENITDQRYRPYSSGISAPGRNFIFVATYSF